MRITVTKGKKVTSAALGNRFDRYWQDVLYDYVVLEDRGAACKPPTYRVIKDLPTKEEYDRLNRKIHSKPLEERLVAINHELGRLAAELQHWLDRQPGKFQESEKASQLRDTLKALHEIEESPGELPRWALRIQVAFWPRRFMPSHPPSRADRAAELASLYEACAAALTGSELASLASEEHLPVSEVVEAGRDLASHYKSQAAEILDLDWPSMF